MKNSFYIFFLSSLALLSFTTVSPVENKLFGTWKGGFGDDVQTHSAIVQIKPGNRLEVRIDDKGDYKMTGSYEMQGDTALVISYTDQVNHKRIIMQGRLNKTGNFMDGFWQTEGKYQGSFYFQKQ